MTWGRLSKSNLNNENPLFQPEKFAPLRALCDLTNLISYQASCAQLAAIPGPPRRPLQRTSAQSSGPLHLLCLLPEMFFPQTDMWLALSFHPGLLNVTSVETSSRTAVSKNKPALAFCLVSCWPAILLNGVLDVTLQVTVFVKCRPY